MVVFLAVLEDSFQQRPDFDEWVKLWVTFGICFPVVTEMKILAVFLNLPFDMTSAMAGTCSKGSVDQYILVSGM